MDSLFIKTNDNFVVYGNHRHTHLTRAFYQFIAFFGILGNVVFRIFYVVFLEKFFCHFAIHARGRCVDCYFFHMTIKGLVIISWAVDNDI